MMDERILGDRPLLDENDVDLPTTCTRVRQRNRDTGPDAPRDAACPICLEGTNPRMQNTLQRGILRFGLYYDAILWQKMAEEYNRHVALANSMRNGAEPARAQCTSRQMASHVQEHMIANPKVLHVKLLRHVTDIIDYIERAGVVVDGLIDEKQCKSLNLLVTSASRISKEIGVLDAKSSSDAGAALINMPFKSY